jgi:DNA-binding NtrC family response regulator
MSAPRIMVIDDEQIVGGMAKMHLVKEGFEVETFLSAVSALERLKQAHFDVVVTDLKMKDVDGMEVLRTVKAEYPDIQVIMITAFAHLSTSIEAFRGEVFDFFPKPFKIKDFVASIHRALELKPKEA